MDTNNKQTEISDAYHAAARVLIGAMLREPHMYQSFRIPAIWFRDTPYAGIATAIETVIELSSAKTYTPSSVRIQAGETAQTITELMQDTTPLELAYEIFAPMHEHYIETLCAAVAFHQSDAASIQETQKQIRAERLVLREGSANTGQDIVSWAIAKIEGNDPTYPTTPHLRTLVDNNIIKHLAPGDFVIVAARPGMGKTQYMLNTLNHFNDVGLPGAAFSLEMSKPQLQQRLLAMRTGKNTLAEWQYFSEADKANVLEQAAQVREMPVSIETIRTIDEIERFARMQKQRSGLEFILVDYLQLVVTGGKKSNNREQDVSDVSRRLKSLAMELQVPVVALSQLSRAVETRGGIKRPQLSDLRESGSLEQDADIVIFLYRPAYYEITEQADGTPIIIDARTKLQHAEVIVAKNRHGSQYSAAVHYTPVLGYIDPVQVAASVDTFPVYVPAQAMPKVDIGQDIPF